MPAFWSRILVALVLLPLVFGIVWLGGWWLTVLALVAGLIALHELYTLARGLRPLVLGGYAGLVLVLVGAQTGGPVWAFGGLLATFFVTFVLFGLADARPSATASVGTTLMGVAWVGGGLTCGIFLRDIDEHGRLAMFTVLICVFADDTLAYFVGRAVGRHKLAPQISPGKSWEGLVIGTLAAIAVAFFALYEEGFLSNGEAVALGAVVAVAAVAGDLFESAVKRDLGAKDSGRLLAGHGGILDRLDATLFALPAALFTVLAFGAG